MRPSPVRVAILAALAAAAVRFAAPVAAGTTIVANGSAQIYVGAGSSLTAVDSIRFSVPGADVGSGAPVTGREGAASGATLVDAYARAPGGQPRSVVWSVDSSQPLVCTTAATCGSTTIPMSKFRWIASGGSEVGNGAFRGVPNQVLHVFPTSRYVYVYKTFLYANDEIVPAGTYVGRVVYTLSMP